MTVTPSPAFKLLLSGLLFSGSLASFCLAIHLMILVQRFTSDLPEVLATYEVIQQSLVYSGVLLSVGLLTVRRRGS